MKITAEIVKQQAKDLNDMIGHLDYALNQVKDLSPNPYDLDEAKQLVWDGFAMRFSRTADLFLSKFLRTVVLESDPGFDGYFRDFLNNGAKLGILIDDDVETWVVIRKLRNKTVHDYADEIESFYNFLRDTSPFILKLKPIVEKYL